jgi:hypothetical protein
MYSRQLISNPTLKTGTHMKNNTQTTVTGKTTSPGLGGQVPAELCKVIHILDENQCWEWGG